ncbi:MAG: hypothetical protein RIT45_369 [Pseudomonadota bacterium]|jgi:hypothetical protein
MFGTMSLFQLLGLGAASAMALLSALAMARNPSRRVPLLPWLALWSLAALAFAVPDVTTRFAHLLGIGRGADVVLYCAVFGGLLVAFRLSMAQRRLERELTLLVRELAVQQARRPEERA